MKVDSGVLAIESTHVPQSAGDIENVLLVNTDGSGGFGRAQMVGFNSGSNNVTNGVRIEGGSSGIIPTCIVFTPNIFNSTNAISSDGQYQTINFLGGRIENVAYAVNVDLTGTGVDSVFRITSNHQPNYLYPPSAAYNSDFALDFMQEPTERFPTTKNIFGIDRLSVGFPEKPAEVHIGQGAPYTDGMIVLTTDNTAGPTSDGANFIDVSEESKSIEGSTFTFQTGATNTTILFTSIRLESDLTTPVKFYGIDIDVLSRAEGGEYVVEYWNGSSWVEDLYQSHSDELGFFYNKSLFIRNQSKEHISFNIDKNNNSWTPKTINGFNGHWMRFRKSSSGTTSPIFESLDIVPNTTTITKSGTINFNGKATFKKTFEIFGGSWGEGTGTLTDFTTTVGSGTNPTQEWTHNFPKANFSADGEAATFAMKIPKGANTAQKFNVYANYILDGSAADTTSAGLIFSLLPVEMSGVLVSDPNGSKVLTPRTVSATTAFNTYTAQTNSVSTDIGSNKLHSISLGQFDLSNYYPDDMMFMRLEKDSGTNVNLNLVSLSMDVDMWTLGSQSESPVISAQTIFNETWEDQGVANGWVKVQDAAEENLWVISTGTSRNGNYSAYVTNDSGGTEAYAYTITNTQGGAHLYTDVSIPANARSLTVSFYWTCLGENGTTGGGAAENYDFGRVGIAPTSFTPSANSEFTDTFRVGATTNLNKFNEGYNGGASAGNWTLETIPIPSSLWVAGTDARLIFTWVNDGSIGDQPPFAVDDITVSVEVLV
jgi:hypothetical protein